MQSVPAGVGLCALGPEALEMIIESRLPGREAEELFSKGWFSNNKNGRRKRINPPSFFYHLAPLCKGSCRGFAETEGLLN